MSTFRPAKPAHQEPAVNTLRMDGATLAKVQEALDSTESASAKIGAIRRAHKRWQFRAPAVRIDITHPNGQVVPLVFACRNLSSGGVAVLHSAYMHPGTRVVVHLKHQQKGYQPIEGVVRRCRHVHGTVHEIGIKFAASVNVSAYMEVDPFKGQFSLEAVSGEKLSGKVLQVEDGALDRRLFRHLLENTRLNVTAVETAAEALTKMKEPWDVLIIDTQLPGAMDGFALVEKIRADGVQTPVLLVSADRLADVSARARAVRASGVIAKPFKREVLLAALAEFLLNASSSGDTGGAITTSLSADDPLAKLVPDFVTELHQSAARLRNAVKSGDAEAVKLECFQIVGVAGTLGLEPVSRAAEGVLRAISAGGGVPEAQRPVQDLIAACMRVRVSAQAA